MIKSFPVDPVRSTSWTPTGYVDSVAPWRNAFSTYSDGEHITKGEKVTGDFLHHLPYSYTLMTVKSPDWTAEVKRYFNVLPDHPNYGVLQEQSFHPGLGVTGIDLRSIPQRSPRASVVNMVDSMAILKAQASLNKQIVSVPLIFMERKKTFATMKKYSTFIMNNAVTMQRKDVKRWLKALKKRSSPNRLKKIASDIANGHLEFVFGVLPLIEEIQSLAENTAEFDRTFRTGRGRHRQVDEFKMGRRNIDGQKGVFYEDTHIVDYSVRCNLRCEITSSIKNNASLLGFNPVYVWYDWTPLSFVVGWFSNFNTWIQALDPLIGLDYTTGSSSKMSRVSLHREGQIKYGNVAGYIKDVGATSSLSTATIESFSREVHPTFPPLQGLRLMDKTSTFTHLASLSLAIQRFVKESKRESKVKAFRYRGPKPRFLKPIKYRKVQL